MPACAGDLLAREGQARDARRGLWRSWAYRVQDATDVTLLGRLTQTYQLVEGMVHAVGEGKKKLYVNFAPDWRNDFTIVVDCPLRGGGARIRQTSRCAGPRAGLGGMVERPDNRGERS
jgi:hypothetical protein